LLTASFSSADCTRAVDAVDDGAMTTPARVLTGVRTDAIGAVSGRLRTTPEELFTRDAGEFGLFQSRSRSVALDTTTGGRYRVVCADALLPTDTPLSTPPSTPARARRDPAAA
jgi:hypothetical protein